MSAGMATRRRFYICHRSQARVVEPDLGAKSEDQLAELYVQAVKLAVHDLPGAERLLLELDAETDRRAAAPDSVDELVAKGWTYIEAYADVHGLDPAELQREERMAEVRQAQRLHGGAAELHMCAKYNEETDLRWMAAEHATDGHMLNMAGRAAALDRNRKVPINGRMLFSGPAAVARRYASDELKAWWEAHGGRVTYVEWRAKLLGDRATVQTAARGGAGRDFNL